MALYFVERPREAQRDPRGPQRPKEAQRGPEKPKEPQRHRDSQRGPERPREAQRGPGTVVCMYVDRPRDAERGQNKPVMRLAGWLGGWLAGWLGQESLEGHWGSSCPELSGFCVCQFQASKDNGAPAVGYCVVLCVSQLGAPGPPWGCNCLSDKPREAQRGQERLREAQRGPKKPREPQIGTETHREAQRGPERPKEAYVVYICV